MEIIHYLITCDGDNPLPRLFQPNEDGHLCFGFFGKSKEKVSINQVCDSEIEFIDYVMEGFIRYFMTVKTVKGGLQLSIRKTGSNRDQHLGWLIEHQVSAQGCCASRVAD